ncbi:MAG: PilZ domain-containing protein [Cellvibrionaceae bacterium]|nr:PilZ domain-containing protein [Cellvibrionaceae bacterium]MCV6625504.1 PilZ domain-containing protein [Cellvibrionaceae bacterium]
MTDSIEPEREQRRSTRVSILCRMKISHPSFGEREVNTRDISDEGLFLLLDTGILPAEGSILQGQVQGLLENTPLLDLKLVRQDEQGAGFTFVGHIESWPLESL